MKRLLYLVPLLLYSLAFGARTHVQGNSIQCSSNITCTLTLTSNPTVGNLVAISWHGNTVTGLTCKDGNNNPYTNSPNSPNTHLGQNDWLAYLAEAPANADKNITCTWTTAVASNIYGDEFSPNSGNKLVFDKDASGNGNTGTNINSPSITATNSGSLLYASAVSQAAITAPAADATIGVWTGGHGGPQGNSMNEYCLTCGTGAVAVNMTQTNNDIWTAMSMAFFESSNQPGFTGLPKTVLLPKTTVF